MFALRGMAGSKPAGDKKTVTGIDGISKYLPNILRLKKTTLLWLAITCCNDVNRF